MTDVPDPATSPRDDSRPAPPPPLPGDPPPMPSYASTPGPPPIGYGYMPPVLEPMTPADERLWAMLAHLSELAFSIFAPILILAIFGKRSAFVADQSKEALNFQLTVLIAALVSAVLIIVVVGIFLLIAVGIAAMVFAIIAGVSAYNGTLYRYPICIRFLN